MQHMVPSLSTSGRGGRSVQRLSEKNIKLKKIYIHDFYITGSRQDPTQSNVDKLNNVKREASRHFRHKKEGISTSKN